MASQNDTNTGGIEHPTPECPNCGGRKTRPLDRQWATCFDCDDNWMMAEKTQEQVAHH